MKSCAEKATDLKLLVRRCLKHQAKTIANAKSELLTLVLTQTDRLFDKNDIGVIIPDQFQPDQFQPDQFQPDQFQFADKFCSSLFSAFFISD